MADITPVRSCSFSASLFAGAGAPRHRALLRSPRAARAASSPMIFLAAAGIVVSTTVLVGVAVGARITELMTHAARKPTEAAETSTSETPAESSPCVAHLMHLYQQA